MVMSALITEKSTNNVEKENQNDAIYVIQFEVENKTVIPIQDIETFKLLTKKFSSETNKAKCVRMELFDTFYDDYIEYKDFVNDILLAICHTDVIKTLETELIIKNMK